MSIENPTQNRSAEGGGDDTKRREKMAYLERTIEDFERSIRESNDNLEVATLLKHFGGEGFMPKDIEKLDSDEEGRAELAKKLPEGVASKIYGLMQGHKNKIAYEFERMYQDHKGQTKDTRYNTLSPAEMLQAFEREAIRSSTIALFQLQQELKELRGY